MYLLTKPSAFSDRSLTVTLLMCPDTVTVSNRLCISNHSICTLSLQQGAPCILPERCDTKGGAPCDFPFDYDGKRYYSCTWESAITKKNSKPWCATNTSSMSHSDQSIQRVIIEWGDCRESCPTGGSYLKILSQNWVWELILCIVIIQRISARQMKLLHIPSVAA